MSWEEHSAEMDAAVDTELGDSIQYATSGGNFVDVIGFVIPVEEPLTLDGIDASLGSRFRLKIAKTTVGLIEQSHRFRATRLGEGTFKPGPEQPDEDGRYWIFDVQKAPS